MFTSGEAWKIRSQSTDDDIFLVSTSQCWTSAKDNNYFWRIRLSFFQRTCNEHKYFKWMNFRRWFIYTEQKSLGLSRLRSLFRYSYEETIRTNNGKCFYRFLEIFSIACVRWLVLGSVLYLAILLALEGTKFLLWLTLTAYPL